MTTIIPASPAYTSVIATANGQTAFDFDFLANQSADLQAVYYPLGNGTPVTLAGGVDFTITAGAGDPDGGTITLTDGSFVQETAELTILRRVVIERSADYQRDLYSSDLNGEQGKIFQILQQLARDVDSALKVTPGQEIPTVDFLLTQINAAIEAAADAAASEVDAEAAASSAAADAIAAGASASAAAASQSAAGTSATNAAASASAASGSATSAGNSASAASTSAGNASTSATNAAASASAAAGSATAAGNSATAAAADAAALFATGIGKDTAPRSVTDLDDINFLTGPAWATTTASGTWAAGTGQVTIEYVRYSGTAGRMTKTYVAGVNAGLSFERVMAADVWGPWRRMTPSTQEVYPKGAVGDGSTNDDDAMLAWFEEVKAGKIGVLEPGKNYYMTQGFSAADVNIVIRGNGARITKTGQSRHFTINNTFADMYTSGLTLVSNTYDFGDGAIPVTRVQRSGGWSAYAVGDIVKIGTDAVIPTDATNNREAEFAQVGAISGNDLILTHRLMFPTGANPIIGRIRKDVRIDIQDLELDHTGYTATTAWDLDRLRIQATYMPSLRNVHVLKAAAQGVTFASCYMHQAIACSARDCRTYIAGDAYGYGFVSKASAYGTHIGPRVYNCRHGFTTVCQPTTAGDGNLVDRGRNCHETIVGGMAFGCTNAAWDTHADSFNTEFHGCKSVHNYAPVGGERMHYELRGINDRAVGCKSVGGRGFFINRHASQSWVQQNWYCAVIDCEHTSLPSDATTDTAFRALGDSGTPLSGEQFVNCRHIRNGSPASSFEIGHAEVLIINPVILGAVASAGNVHDFRALDGGRYVIRGGFIDHRGSDAGASFRIFRGDEPGTYFDVKNLDLKTIAGQLAAVVSAVDAVGAKDVTANIRMTSNVVQTAMTIVGTQLTTTRIFIDIQDDVDGTFNSNHQSQTFGTTGNKSLSMNRRGGDTVYFAITTSASGVAINDVSAGARVGQNLIIHNLGASANNLGVTAVGGVLELGASATLTPGQALRLMWTGAVWVKAA
jgi:hypothetical protein